PNSWGADSATAIASDGKGGTASATARVYVRNPNPPTITLGSSGSTNCGFGTPNPTGFNVTITPAEDILITDISVQARDCVGCGFQNPRTYNPPIAVRAGTMFVWTDWCITDQCCNAHGCASCSFWSVEISGRRPAPDGGDFTFTCPSWFPNHAGC